MALESTWFFPPCTIDAARNNSICSCKIEFPKWKWHFDCVSTHHCMEYVYRLKFVCFHIKIFQRKMHNDDLSTNNEIHLYFCIVFVCVCDWLIPLYCNDPYLHNIQHTNARDVRNKFENWKERKKKRPRERKREWERSNAIYKSQSHISLCFTHNEINWEKFLFFWQNQIHKIRY